MRAADDSFWLELSSVVDQGRRVLVLEKIARGAGQTRWFMVRGQNDVDAAARAVRPGSAIQIYVDPAIAIEGHAAEELADSVKPIAASVRPTVNDLVALVLRDGAPCCDHAFLDPPEISPWLKEHEGQYVLFRHYPQLGEQDMEAVVPDEDGVVRAHPH